MYALQRPADPSYRVMAAGFVLLCLFPWLSFGLLDLDTQPWFIIAALSFCALSFHVKADSVVVAGALLLTGAAVLSGLASMKGADFLLLRGVLSYLAFSTVLLGYYYYRRRFGFPLRVFVVANLIWLAAGAVQAAVDPQIFEMLVVVRTTADRGVSGLAPEPTHYGMVLLFLSWILLIESDYRPSRGLALLICLNLVFILIVAKSAMALVFVACLLAAYVVFGVAKLKHLLYAIGLCLAISAAIYFLYHRFPEWRVFRIVVALGENPLLVMRADASINQRIAHLVFSFYGVGVNDGLPGGFQSFSEINSLARAAYGGLFWYGEDDNKIMSGIGAVVYELGWLSSIFFALVGFCALAGRQWRLGAFHLFGFLGTFTSALPVSFPLVPIILISMLFWGRRNGVARNGRRRDFMPKHSGAQG